MQLAEVISQLPNHQYAQPLDVLSGNTVGKHVRHILEFFDLLIGSVQTGQLSYDRRERDLRLEIDANTALQRIGTVDRAIQRADLHSPLQLDADLSDTASRSIQIPSSFARELLYNVEHAIHHMALIQVAVRVAFPQVNMPANFGVAYSTIQYNAQH